MNIFDILNESENSIKLKVEKEVSKILQKEITISDKEWFEVVNDIQNDVNVNKTFFKKEVSPKYILDAFVNILTVIKKNS